MAITYLLYKLATIPSTKQALLEVLPCLSRVTTTLSIGILMRLATAEIMRILAWCGTATMLQKAIGANCPAFDLQSVCAGLSIAPLHIIKI
jgi:hypothetical protein